MKKEDFVKLFQLFVSKDDYRVILHSPFKQKKYIFASDGYTAIRISENNLDIELPYMQEEKPNINEVFRLDKNVDISIGLHLLEDKLTPVLIDEIINIEDVQKCQDCNGSGTVTYEYSSYDNGNFEIDSDCPICDSNGEIVKNKKVSTGKMIADQDYPYEINGSIFKYLYLKRLIDSCKIIGCDKISLVHSTKRQASLFVCGDFEILIMPLSYSDENEKKIIKII